MSGASELVNGQASGPVLQSVFLVILAHSALRQVSLIVDIDNCVAKKQDEKST